MQKAVTTLIAAFFTFTTFAVQADTFGTYNYSVTSWSGAYPDTGYLKRPYVVDFQSNIDGYGDWYSICFPADFDPDKSYPVWLKFTPVCGSGSHLHSRSHAWNYSDSNDVIVVGCHVRSSSARCNPYFGDNENWDAATRAAIPADVVELLNQLFYLFNIEYVAASGASQGGYSSFRVMTYLPSNYVGAVVSSATAIFNHPYTDAGSEAIEDKVAEGHFTDKFVQIIHGDSDATIGHWASQRLTDAAPDTSWWDLRVVPGAGHAEFFARFDYSIPFPHSEEYGQCPEIPDIWDRIRNWENAHPDMINRALDPLPGWSPPSNWYVPQNIYEARADKSGSPPANVAPVAEAGPDQTVTDADENGIESVTLDGTASSDSDGTIQFYDWHESSTLVGTGSSTPVVLGVGTHTITLTVTDDDGAQDTDTLTVTVLDGSTPEPPSGTVTSLFQKGVSPSLSYAGTLDSTLRSLTGSSFGYHSLGKDPSLDPRWKDVSGTGILHFDLSSIPADATIQSASLRMWISASEFDSTSGDMVMYRLHDPDGTGMWEENDDASSYGGYDATTAKGCARVKRPNVVWSGTGGRVTDVTDPAEERSFFHTAGNNEWMTFNVTPDVQAFVTEPADNLGWMFHAASDNTVRGEIYTGDHADILKRPILEVAYSVNTNPPANAAPVAVAGADQTVIDSDDSGSENVTLDGSGSSDSDGSIVSYDWQESGSTIAAGISPSVDLAVGSHTITLVVTDDDGATGTDTAVITVDPSGTIPTNNPPTAVAGLDQTVTDSDDSGSENVTLDGSGSSDSDGSIVSYDWQESGASIASGASPSVDLAVGSHTITLTVTDDDGATASDTVLVTVQDGGTPPPSGGKPSLSTILAACQYLTDGDIPNDTFTPPANAIYVAPASMGGSDANSGTSISSPFEHIGKAIDFANNNSGTPYTIYLRGGTYYYKTYDVGQVISRGNLYITAYNNEEVIIRPFYWPNNPSSWSDLRCFIVRGPAANVTFDNLIIEGWQVTIDAGSTAGSPLRQVALKNLEARTFTRRGAGSLAIFLQTANLTSDVYGSGKAIFDDPDVAAYQIEDLIVDNVDVHGADLTINVGDENDANVKGMRVTDFRLSNPPGGGSGTSANDGIAVVNSYRVLIDHCTIDNVQDDGIDCKSYNVAVVNTLVRGTTRNAVKFWRTGELINSIVYDCTIINDGAIIVADGPARIVHSILMRKSSGYAGTFAYTHSSSHSADFDIINSIFADLDHSFYVVNNNLSSKNSLYYDMPDRLFSGGVGSIYDVATLNARSGSSGNISAAPGLVDAAGGDFSPAAGSPLVNAGTSSGVLLPSFDFYGNARATGGTPDIGPIEYGSTSAPPANVAPTAVAGADQTVVDDDNDGAAEVTLDASSSFDSDGTLVAYDWTENGSALASGVSPTLNLGVGVYQITLTVTDDDGAQDTDALLVTILEGGTTPSNLPPLAVAGSDQTLADGDDSGSENVTLDGSGSSDSDGSIVSYDWQESGSTIASGASPSVDLSVGTHTITLIATDDDGAQDTDDVVITVNAGGGSSSPSGVYTSLFQKGVAPSAGFAGVLDSTFRSADGHTFGLHARGKDPSFDPRWRDSEGTALLQVNVSSIPAGAVIQSASLKMWMSPSEFETTSGNLVMYRLNDPDGTGMWAENNDASTYTTTDASDAAGCARYKKPNVPWIGTDGRYTSVIDTLDERTAFHTAGEAEWLTFDVTTDIQAYLDGTAANLGWVFHTESDNTVRGEIYMSDHSDAAKRPVLEVVYAVNLDSDGDGATDVAENIAGTDPNDPNDVLHMIGRMSNTTNITVEWQSQPGRSYDLLTSTNLFGSWTTVPGLAGLAGDGSMLSVSNIPYEGSIYFLLQVSNE